MKASESSRSGVRGQRKQRVTSRTSARKRQGVQTATAAGLDQLHEEGGDLSAHLDLANANRPGRAVQRVNVDFPLDLLQEIDREARRVGVTRQAFIKLRLADALASR